MSGQILEMSTKTSDLASPRREKCSRNKRKFRQDPPFSNQEISDLNHTSENNAAAGVAAVSIEEEKRPTESRSVKAATGKINCEDSNQKESEGETNSVHGKSEATKYCHPKLRWFRPGHAKVAQAGGSVVAGDSEHAVESKASTDPEDDETSEPEFGDWTEGEFEELLVKTLGSLYNEAIDKIVASGHGKEEALDAVLRQGRCSGAKDAVTNIVENSLAYLNGSKQLATDGEDRNFSDLRELQKYSLAEMIKLLREVRPLLSKGEAMWRLLMCDLNIELACGMDDSALLPPSKEPIPGPPANQSGPVQAEVTTSTPSVAPSDGSLPSTAVSIPSIKPFMDPPSATILTQSPVATPSRSKHSPARISPAALSPPGSPTPNRSPPSSEVTCLSLLDRKPQSSSGGEITDASSTWDTPSIDRDVSRVTDRLSVDACTSQNAKQVEATAESTEVPAISLLKLDDKVDQDEQLEDAINDERRASASATDPPSEPPSFTVQAFQARDECPKDGEICNSSDEELHRDELQPPDGTMHADKPLEAVRYPDSVSSSGDARGATRSLQDGSICDEQGNSGSAASPRQEAARSTVRFGTFDEPVTTVTAEGEQPTRPNSDAEGSCPAGESVIGNGGAQQAFESANVVQDCTGKEISTAETEVEDLRDERIMKLEYRVGELEAQLQEREAQLQERFEWAKQKVMQAARKLSKDLQELKALRNDRDEALRLKKDRQASEGHAVKRITESEDALRKTRSELDIVNLSKAKLDKEIAVLRAEMEAAKLSAAEAQATCRDMEKRERKYTKRAQAWEKQKAKLQEELSEEKKKGVDYKQQCVQSKEREQQAEVRWLQEEKAKEDANRRAEHERRAREQSESVAKKREESLRRKAESNYQRHRDDIQRLESEIAQFRTSAEAAQLATSRWGPGVAVNPQMMELSSLQALNNRLTRELSGLQGTGRRDVRRERECVMCMGEEISVVFLPCAHQVVCVKCNELHQARDMRDCPSCRTPIKQRIRVYGVST